jgi:hypothetical protein
MIIVIVVAHVHHMDVAQMVLAQDRMIMMTVFLDVTLLHTDAAKME